MCGGKTIYQFNVKFEEGLGFTFTGRGPNFGLLRHNTSTGDRKSGRWEQSHCLFLEIDYYFSHNRPFFDLNQRQHPTQPSTSMVPLHNKHRSIDFYGATINQNAQGIGRRRNSSLCGLKGLTNNICFRFRYLIRIIPFSNY